MYIRDNGDSLKYNNERMQDNRYNLSESETLYEDTEEEITGKEILNEEDYDAIINQDALLEAYFIDTISRMSDEERNAFFNSDGFQALYESDIITRRGTIALNKVTDFARRKKLAVLELAKKAGDPIWQQIMKYRKLINNLMNKADKKYHSKAEIEAKKAQNRYFKIIKAGNLGKTFSNLTGIR